MIFIKKSNGADLQPMLEKARTKDNENVYREGSVFDRIKTDFHSKCYICEDNEMTSIQIEHFEPHKKDPIKKYDWNNLFYSCGHCNNIKGILWPLLDCTNPNDNIWESIEIRFEHSFPTATLKIRLTENCLKQNEGENTRLLLEKALAGKNTTPMKQEEASNLRKKMLRAYNELSIAIQKDDTESIKAATSDNAAFSGMLRWHLKNDYPEIFAKLVTK